MIKHIKGIAFACVCAVSVLGSAFPVFAAETVSGNDIVTTASETAAPVEESVSGNDIVNSSGATVYVVTDVPTVASAYDSYYGSISNTYLEYMRGYLSKLPSSAHYVGARVGQYDYIFAYGDNLEWNGSAFVGAVNVARWNTYNYGTFSVGYDNNFSLSPASALVYTDLTDKYPALATSSDMTLRQIVILLTIFCLCVTIEHMYQVRKIRRVKFKEV